MNRVSSLCFIGMGSKLTVMRLFFSLVHPLLRASGKDKAMKRIPKTPIEFDYDLWTTEDGKCMVRVKITGEVSEVDREVMKVLRAEEKKLRRSYANSSDDEGESCVSTLSLDVVSSDEVDEASWLEDKSDDISFALTKICVEEVLLTLSPFQREVFDIVMMGGVSIREFARVRMLHHKTVEESVCAIRKKFKNIL
jgi:hypothetical protein